jgi:hypothetical protein
MATEAQIKANQANAQHSTGPKTMAGKIAVAQNNFRHGLSGHFQVLPWESREEYEDLRDRLRTEYQVTSPFEEELVGRMAQHYWLTRRALFLQETCFSPEMPLCEQEKQLALYLRYQTTHERAFQRCSDELRKLRNEKRKAEIGFVSQQRQQKQDARKEAEEARRQAAENRKQELHQWAVLLAKAKLDQHNVLTSGARLPQTMGSIRPSREGDGAISADAA